MGCEGAAPPGRRAGMGREGGAPPRAPGGGETRPSTEKACADTVELKHSWPCGGFSLVLYTARSTWQACSRVGVQCILNGQCRECAESAPDCFRLCLAGRKHSYARVDYRELSVGGRAVVDEVVATLGGVEEGILPQATGTRR